MLEVGQEVYLTAYLSEDSSTIYICKGKIERKRDDGTFKVRIISVADRPTGGRKSIKQGRLLGLLCTKRANDLANTIPQWIQPTGWIDQLPKDLRR